MPQYRAHLLVMHMFFTNLCNKSTHCGGCGAVCTSQLHPPIQAQSNVHTLEICHNSLIGVGVFNDPLIITQGYKQSNGKFKSMWKEAVASMLRQYTSICAEALRKTRIALIQDRRSAGRDWEWDTLNVGSSTATLKGTVGILKTLCKHPWLGHTQSIGLFGVCNFSCDDATLQTNCVWYKRVLLVTDFLCFES